MSQDKCLHRRESYFVKRDFQLKFILKFCLLLLVGFMISTALLFFFSLGTLTSSFHQSRLVISSTGLAILPSILYTNLITLALISLATVLVTLFVCHKIAGPMLRFEKEVEAVTAGDLTKRIALRKDDQMTDMANSLNGMIASLHGKVLDIRAEVEHIRESASRQGAPEELLKQLEHLHRTIKASFVV